MLHPNGTRYALGRPANPGRPRLATPAQQRAAARWATAFLAAASPAELRTALKVLAKHPDAASAGYSKARQALERVRGELALRGLPEVEQN